MVVPGLVIAGGSLLAGLVPTAMSIGAKTQKFYGKYGNTSLGQASQFGLGYGASTNIGYNLSNNFITPGWSSSLSSSTGNRTYNYSMPYGNYRNYGNRYSRYSRYSRFGRRSRYSSRYSRYRRRYY